jgi:heterodisulfide reductase subunit A
MCPFSAISRDEQREIAVINEALCKGCGTCPFSAISRDEQREIAVINEALCKGCGTCVAACPSGAAQQNLFTDEQIYEEIDGVLGYV